MADEAQPCVSDVAGLRLRAPTHALATAGGWQQQPPPARLRSKLCCILKGPERGPHCARFIHTRPRAAAVRGAGKLWGAGPSARLASLPLQLVACCAWRRRSIELADHACCLPLSPLFAAWCLCYCGKTRILSPRSTLCTPCHRTSCDETPIQRTAEGRYTVASGRAPP